MSPAAAFHAQLASIVEALANTAVAEICELVDTGYAVLQREISRSRKESEALRRKLRLAELRAARGGAALRAAAGGGTACGGLGTALPARHPGNEPRSNETPGGEAALSSVSSRRGDPDPASGSGPDAPPAGGSAAVKVEEDESWSHSEPDNFCRVVDGQTTETEAPPPLMTKQEAAVVEGGGSAQAWVSGASSTSTLNTIQRPESSSHERLMYGPPPPLQHGSLTTHNPLSEYPGCSYLLDTSAGISGGGGSLSAAERQQGAPLTADEPRLPVRKPPATERQNAIVRRDRWRPQGGGGRTFVCSCCGKSLACLKNLKTHMRVHTGEKPFICALCGKRFSDSSNLKRHQSVHTGEKRYGCVHCGKRFAQSGSLKVHMAVHTDCKQFRCPCCGKTFISGSHLRRHVAAHAAERRAAPTFH